MDVSLARWLVSSDAEQWLRRAADEPDPDSLAAASRWRRHLEPDKAAAVLTQTTLRRDGVRKAGERAGELFWTRDGLEQATRPEVAAWRAGRYLAGGVTHVWDLGCGLGLDALALVDAGLEVAAVERDPVTAVLAAANLGERATVLTADVADVAGSVPTDAAVFLDPARRTGRGRSWDVGDLSPSWDVVTALASGERVACVKLGPGVPYSLLPTGADTVWVSDHGDLVEAAVWTGPGAFPGRGALLLPGGDTLAADGSAAEVSGVRRWLYEPDPGVIRAGAVGVLAALLGATALASGVAYLSADELTPTPYATAFEVTDRLPYRERDLRAWVRQHHVGTLEIKKRGLDVDPAALRRRLSPKGLVEATLVLTPTPDGAAALVVRRVVDEG